MDQETNVKLQKLLGQSEAILWKVIFDGGFATEELAKAAYDSHKAVKKAKGLVEEHLSQGQMEV